MPVLPKYGWFGTCDECDAITSRTMVVRHSSKKKQLYVCRVCRLSMLEYFLGEFKCVVVAAETAGQIDIDVSR